LARFKVGIDLHPQHCTVAELRRAWMAADELGVDTIWTWDHFFPLPAGRMVAAAPNPATAGTHFEAWTLLTAMAVETSWARIGTLVTANGLRNPDLLADMARTIDHLSGGRLILGIGAGWAERDYREYGYEFDPPPARLKALGESLVRVKARFGQLQPGPAGPLPILVGGGGERVTLKLVAQHADMWNAFGPVDSWTRKNRILDDWCVKVERDPSEIERTVGIAPDEVDNWQAYLEAGAEHIIVMVPPPFDLYATKTLLAAART
jgi:probable F420-dependent oxidoreductase